MNKQKWEKIFINYLSEKTLVYKNRKNLIIIWKTTPLKWAKSSDITKCSTALSIKTQTDTTTHPLD